MSWEYQADDLKSRWSEVLLTPLILPAFEWGLISTEYHNVCHHSAIDLAISMPKESYEKKGSERKWSAEQSPIYKRKGRREAAVDADLISGYTRIARQPTPWRAQGTSCAATAIRRSLVSKPKGVKKNRSAVCCQSPCCSAARPSSWRCPCHTEMPEAHHCEAWPCK